jgi:hypothetical protein
MHRHHNPLDSARETFEHIKKISHMQNQQKQLTNE